MMDSKTRELSQDYRRNVRPPDACPESADLAELAGGRPWPWQRRRLVNHLASCPHCASDFQTLLAMRGGLHDALGAPRPGERSRVGWLAAFGTAGACAAVLVAVLLLPQGMERNAPVSTESDLLFASDFAPGTRQRADETLFSGDFDGPGSDHLFESNFGGDFDSGRSGNLDGNRGKPIDS